MLLNKGVVRADFVERCVCYKPKHSLGSGQNKPDTPIISRLLAGPWITPAQSQNRNEYRSERIQPAALRLDA
ncbi:MAG: hypothetical protein V7634_543 [Bradyrhizobium sp.]